MNTSEEEPTTHDSEGSDEGKVAKAHISTGDQIIVGNVDIQWQEHIELREIYEGLSPESADRILSMVEREQNYEKKAHRTESWLTLLRWIGGLVGITAIISSFVFVGLSSESTHLSVIAASLTVGAVLPVLLKLVTELVRPWYRQSAVQSIFRHRVAKESDPPHRDKR
jgi:hypothetical protein